MKISEITAVRGRQTSALTFPFGSASFSSFPSSLRMYEIRLSWLREARVSYLPLVKVETWKHKITRREEP